MINSLLIVIMIVSNIYGACAQPSSTTTTSINPDDLILKCPPEKILFDRQYTKRKWNKSKEAYDNLGEWVSYLYFSEEEVPAEKDEVISKRTKNTQFFNNEKGEWVARCYAGEPFYKNGSTWYLTQVHETTLEAYNSQTGLSWYEKLWGKAWATTFYAGNGDGYVERNSVVSWNDARNGNPGSGNDDTSTTLSVHGDISGAWLCSRGFFPVDTSGLGSGAVVTSASFKFFVLNPSVNLYRIIQTSQASTASLANTDYQLVGSTAGAASFAPGFGSNTKSLNATGIGWIDVTGWTKLGIREEDHDIDNVAPVGADTCVIGTSEQGAAGNRPQLIITFNTPSKVEIDGESIEIDGESLEIDG
jgi:hypothetical protein